MAFHVVSSFLLRVLASKTTLWMAGIFQQPIRCFCFMVFEANTRSKKEDTTWKAMKNWVRKCYIFLCTINFEVTWPFWKMCDCQTLNGFHWQRWPASSRDQGAGLQGSLHRAFQEFGLRWVLPRALPQTNHKPPQANQWTPAQIRGQSVKHNCSFVRNAK